MRLSEAREILSEARFGRDKKSSGLLIGYKALRYDPATRKVVSGANSRLSLNLNVGAVHTMPPPGIFLAASKEYVLDYYAGHDITAVIAYAFDPADVTSGSMDDREPEITVSKARVREVTLHRDSDLEEAREVAASLRERKRPNKGKKWRTKCGGKEVSHGDPNARIAPGTPKGDAYCARSAKIKDSGPCSPNALSRKKWRCRGTKSVAEARRYTKKAAMDAVKKATKNASLEGKFGLRGRDSYIPGKWVTIRNFPPLEGWKILWSLVGMRRGPAAGGYGHHFILMGPTGRKTPQLTGDRLVGIIDDIVRYKKEGRPRAAFRGDMVYLAGFGDNLRDATDMARAGEAPPGLFETDSRRERR